MTQAQFHNFCLYNVECFQTNGDSEFLGGEGFSQSASITE